MFAPLAALAFSAQTTPAKPAKFPLTVESIMRGYALVGHPPTALQWSEDGKTLRFNWAKPDGKTEPSYKQYQLTLGETKAVEASGSAQPARRGRRNRGGGGNNPAVRGDQSLTIENGDVYLIDSKTNEKKQLTKTPKPESLPTFLLDGRVAYQREGNVFVVDPATLAETAITSIEYKDIKPTGTQSAPANKNQALLAQEQGKLFAGLNPEVAPMHTVPTYAADAQPFIIRGLEQADGYHYNYATTEWHISSLVTSPSGKNVAVRLTRDASGVRYADVPNYITASGYSETIPTYDKVGDDQSVNGLIIAGGRAVVMNPPRPSSLNFLIWSPNGRYCIAYFEANDFKDAWIMGFDSTTNAVKPLWTEHNDAWVGGPGQAVAGWMPDGSRIYFETENSGYANLMTMAPDGSDVKPIVAGQFEVSNVRLDEPRHRFIFESDEGSPFVHHVGAVDFNGGARTKLADMSVGGEYSLAPNGKDIAVTRSFSNRPEELFVNGVQITNTPTEEWLRGPWTIPPIIKIPARDGAQVPAHLYKPKDWKPGGPAVVFVHGAGYLQNVYEGWSYYYREYMFHHLLMSKGYAVLDMDYRASSGYGSAWRTGIYRFMGGKDLDDNVDGAHWLVKNLGVDPKRIGIYGGSYGGFITLMAMFTSPDTFAAGAALRPVCDWANYNHGYTSRILNNPQDDREAYIRSSPIYHAEGLKGALLICHGMVDTNVHFQDSVRLTERLIELHKTNWTLAPYPREDHSFTRPDSWTDEYTRILDLFERELKKK